MKNQLLLGAFLFFLAPLFSTAQVMVGDIDINQEEAVIFIHVCPDDIRNRQVVAIVDYGQHVPRGPRRNRIMDERGAERGFNSEADISNFLYQQGWEYKSTYTISENNDPVHVYQRMQQ